MNEDHTKALDEVNEEDMRRLAARMKDLVENKYWQDYKQVVQRMISVREELTQAPLITVLPEYADLQSKMIALESVKGAIIGLKLALTFPESIIQHAADVSRERKESQNAAGD